MHKIGVIGDKDSVLGFKALGLSVFPVTGPSDAAEALQRLVREDYAVVYVTEQTAQGISALIDEYKDRKLPAVILIPGNQGSLGIGLSNLKKIVERAVGADILFKE